MAKRASKYANIADAEFIGYDKAAAEKWAAIEKTNTANDERLAGLRQQLSELGPWEAYQGTDPDGDVGPDAHERNKQRNNLENQIYDYNQLHNKISRERQISSLQGEAQVLETKRENRGATVTQGGVNEQVAGAGAGAVRAENLLSQNIGQEIQGRVARNLLQAREAQTAVDKSSAATRGQQAARAGQAGYSAASGTAGAMADAGTSKAAADKAAIEGYRIGRQNLLMGQGEAAAKAAEDLTGSINTGVADWQAKSTSAVNEITGTLLKNVEQITGTGYFSGDAQTQGVKDSEAAVDATLKTWDLKSYMDVLNTLSGRSVNKSTWDQMLLEQKGAPVNPYGQYSSDISPLTPLAGTKSNLLAAAAGGENLDNVYTLSGTKSAKLI